MTWRQHRIVDGAGGAMSEQRNVQQMLELAEQAAIKGDFSSADELLRDAARLQEAEMGPTHPDLANTLNSLAIVAERTGRFTDAEAFYRRSAAIASQSLPADHPIVAESRKNLEDFCRERGVPLVPASATTPDNPTQAVVPSFVPEAPAAKKEAPPPAKTAKPVSKPGTPPSSPDRPSPSATRPVLAKAAVSFPPARRKSWGRVGWMPFAAVVAVAVAVLMRQPSPSQEDSATSDISPAAESVSPPPSPPGELPASPAEQTPTPEAATRDSDPGVGADQPPAPAPSSGTMSLADGQLCQTISTDRDDWLCDPPGDIVAGGPIVFYTRVRSPRDAEVVHRWYNGDTLRQTVRLMIRANVSEGYRTYSRHLVDRAGNWRVEATSDAGDVLVEERFTVR